jgi:hypothetical protein
MILFLRGVGKIPKSDYELRHICLSVCLSVSPSVCLSVCLPVCPHVTIRVPLDYFNEIWLLSIFWKYVEKIQFSLKSDKSNGYFTWRPIYIYDILLNSSYSQKYFRK